MTPTETQYIINVLREAGVKPSSQRLEIMRYLMEHRTHPTVEQIYNDLLKDHPMLSRTTVYNTVWLLAGSGAIKALNIDRTNAHFDYCEMPHAHFRCKQCGKIIDVPFDYSTIQTPTEMQVDSIDLYLEGVCEECKNLTYTF
jgi:Fe2+ or Zn2+ uptake regulation protein